VVRLPTQRDSDVEILSVRFSEEVLETDRSCSYKHVFSCRENLVTTVWLWTHTNTRSVSLSHLSVSLNIKKRWVLVMIGGIFALEEMSVSENLW